MITLYEHICACIYYKVIIFQSQGKQMKKINSHCKGTLDKEGAQKLCKQLK